MKIHIIGCSGSGKTYLASALSQKYHIPHFDLADIIYFLDMPGYLYKHRIILRFIKRKLGIQHGKKEVQALINTIH